MVQTYPDNPQISKMVKSQQVVMQQRIKSIFGIITKVYKYNVLIGQVIQIQLHIYIQQHIQNIIQEYQVQDLQVEIIQLKYIKIILIKENICYCLKLKMLIKDAFHLILAGNPLSLHLFLLIMDFIDMTLSKNDCCIILYFNMNYFW